MSFHPQVATTDSCIKKWPILTGSHAASSTAGVASAADAAPAAATTPDVNENVAPTAAEPEATIAGGASIRHLAVLNDKRHIVTRDTDNSVAIWDVLKAKKVEELGQVDFDAVVKARSARTPG